MGSDPFIFYLFVPPTVMFLDKRSYFRVSRAIEKTQKGINMQSPDQEQILVKLKHLSPSRLAEVADFIDFLQQRDQEKQLQQDYAQTSEAAFNKVWDNDDDTIYDNL